ncbi:hypothetical protein [Pedobacter nototheniae]|uniref:hypothetical protein n=1 Tax=Pedobacter nototheniae TaxID=2488994 RepID=UPI00292E822A|nr:hypothetical protein [Pedobacter nototheniae]
MNKVVLITSGQPSLNPRLVKEADALVLAGYDVTVIYQYWNNWGTVQDVKLLAEKSWKAIRVGGSPDQGKFTYGYSRLKFKCRVFLFKFFSLNPELAIGRCSALLYREAIKHNADLYIAHNLAALPAAIKAAKKNKAKIGFDAEDLHRNEVSNDFNHPDVRLKTKIEDQYFPELDYLTTSSLLISNTYKVLFPELNPVTILNVFEQGSSLNLKSTDKKLKLVWFSQTIGHNRGIEDVLKYLNLSEQMELHLLGNMASHTKEEFNRLCADYNVDLSKVFYYPPIPSTDVINFCSQFDIGLALEPGFCLNNDFALSNKIFTYLQSGLPVIASDTSAQKQFMEEYKGIGFVYQRGNLDSLKNILLDYIHRPDLLVLQKINSKKYASGSLNWLQEKLKFLSVVHHTLSHLN